jgi:hypothetical protein
MIYKDLVKKKIIIPKPEPPAVKIPMDYNTARNNIKQRRERISISDDDISNASIIKNQESDGIHALREQQIPLVYPSNEKPKQNLNQIVINKGKSLIELLNIYFFRISRNTSIGTATRPEDFSRSLPSFCFSRPF